MIGFQSSIATKAARVVKAALGRDVVEFGTRRAHSPEAGVLAGRASYIGGWVVTSPTLAGVRYKGATFWTPPPPRGVGCARQGAPVPSIQKLPWGHHTPLSPP